MYAPAAAWLASRLSSPLGATTESATRVLDACRYFLFANRAVRGQVTMGREVMFLQAALLIVHHPR
jgi:hypothetical protein